ncbi:MAG TPA: TIGR03086 family metal-binding protein [Acidothermaceae bacterium]|jgi:uncharacterized protein (TIGR03086 family)|nr:TIGR03086 family metal-binding protein [Acidothermaceae bacterium]
MNEVETVTRWTVLDDAHEALNNVVSWIGTADWQRPTPCDQWTVAQVFQHATGDQLAWAAAVVGGQGPADDPFAPSEHVDSPAAPTLTTALRAASDAWATIAPDVDDAPTPLPQGAMPAPIAVGACALDAAIHAWDIAVATDQPSPLTPDLAAALMPAAQAIVELLRSFGVYAPALTPEPSDDAAATLLRYLGRDPGWSA